MAHHPTIEPRISEPSRSNYKDVDMSKEKAIEELLMKNLYKACKIIDRAEADKADLLTALEQIRDLDTECCPRCEGSGLLWADGKPHYPSEQVDTIICGNCGGSGRILPENAQDIAIAAIAKANKEG